MRNAPDPAIRLDMAGIPEAVGGVPDDGIVVVENIEGTVWSDLHRHGTEHDIACVEQLVPFAVGLTGFHS